MHINELGNYEGSQKQCFVPWDPGIPFLSDDLDSKFAGNVLVTHVWRARDPNRELFS